MINKHFINIAQNAVAISAAIKIFPWIKIYNKNYIEYENKEARRLWYKKSLEELSK